MESQKLPTLVLKKKKESPIRNFHHWIFDGAVKELSEQVVDGALATVVTESGEVLGTAYVNRKSRIIGRMIAFGRQDPFEALEESLDHAIELRKRMFGEGVRDSSTPPHKAAGSVGMTNGEHFLTNAYRLVNSEGDCLPGLIVDWYAEGAVLQITTLGMEKLKPKIVEMLRQKLTPKWIYEKSTSPSRKEEGMDDQVGMLWADKELEEKGTKNGDRDDRSKDTNGQRSTLQRIEILENNVKFFVDIVGGQKTGFYLDQREMRKLVGSLSAGRRVLNCFSYTGGFSLFAALGGAVRIDSVDDSKEAIEMAKENVELNARSLDYARDDRDGVFEMIRMDVFDYLRKPDFPEYDFIILDPPAFAKKKADLKKACRAYQSMNRLAMEKIKTSGLLLTCSCSYAVDERLFQQIIFAAAREAGKRVRILSKHLQAHDHPINIYHPEGRYLKGFLLSVD